MGIKLRFLSWWTPGWFQKKGLNQLAHSTINGLEKVLHEETSTDKTSKLDNNPKLSYVRLKANLDERVISNKNLNEKRRIMTQTHNELVETMIKKLGHDKAIEIGSETMFQEGLYLGEKFKKILGVGNNIEDLIIAARILYKVLGIDFTIKETENNEMIMVVNHCALAEYYTPETCQVLSAADEGVVQGLNPTITIKFTERITEGCKKCLAPIKVLT
jgi:hypothetical protein